MTKPTSDHVGLSLRANEHKIHDLYLEPDGNLALVYRAEAVGQHARQRLMTYHAEWFLDTEVGVRWLDEIMAQRYNPALTEAVVKAEVINTSGIKDIVSFSVRFDLPMRKLKITEIQATTIYSDLVVTI